MYFIYNFISNLHSYNENASSIVSTFPTITRSVMEGASPPTHTKAQSLEDILLQLGPITDVSYEPFQHEQPRQATRALLPPSFPQKPWPLDYFSLLFTHDLL